MFYMIKECRDSEQGIDYIGNLATTRSGKTCQRWDSNFPHSPNSAIKGENFPEKSLAMAGNKCRDPENENYLWCYTTDPGTRWDKCDVPMCDGKSFN